MSQLAYPSSYSKSIEMAITLFFWNTNSWRSTTGRSQDQICGHFMKDYSLGILWTKSELSNIVTIWFAKGMSLTVIFFTKKENVWTCKKILCIWWWDCPLQCFNSIFLVINDMPMKLTLKKERINVSKCQSDLYPWQLRESIWRYNTSILARIIRFIS